MAPTAVEKKITARTRAVIPVHFAGQSCDMEAIQQIKADAEEKHGRKIFIIEDACHALGSLYKDKKTGSCSFSDMTVMSFHPVKHITTGEGGVVFTNNEELLTKLRLLRSHGITSDPEAYLNHDLAFQSGNPNTCSEVNPWYYEQVAIGFNYRITDIQCALGLSQLKKLSLFRARRREIVDRYNTAFRKYDCIRIPFEAKDCKSNFHLYVLLFDFEKMAMSRARFMEALKERGIQTRVHYSPVHLHSFYRRHFGTNIGDCPNAERYYERCLSMPLHPGMNEDQVDYVIDIVFKLTRGNP
jgi:dTDP-4-amino-4,6-dideoxygalactose transaminase